MARHLLLLFFTFSIVPFLCTGISTLDLPQPRRLLAPPWQPMQCNGTSPTPTCSSYLYVIPGGRSLSEIASAFTANASLFQTITRPTGSQDLLVKVPCICEAVGNGVTALFHDTNYTVKRGDTVIGITSTTFSGLAWNLGDGKAINASTNIIAHLPCGCSTTALDGVVSYAVQEGDVLSNIATSFRSDWQAIINLNPSLTNPDFLAPGWILFVPMGVAANVRNSGQKKRNTSIAIATSIAAAFLLLCMLTIFLRLKRKSRQPDIEEPKRKADRVPSNKSIAALESRFFPSKKVDDFQPFQTERPVIFSLEQVEDATANFAENRKIGEGGYGSVYLGIMGTLEIAIKKMRASKSKEFFAELKVLCKVHHINVVELIGYAAGEDHLFLVYEYVQNGSLSEHLHDPLLKGHQPLSWTARTQIALDAARGIEYIHDHTKACYVHRDIKTSNILLDNGLRAKVADFGLVKLVQRSEDEESLATRLVGTPGYLPPESVLELHMTTKSDVYAFGVVLAELITGLRALVRDNKEANKMKSLISIMRKTFGHDDRPSSLEKIIDINLKDNYPIEEVHKMANVSMWCLSDDPLDRPEMREIMLTLSQIHMASIEWEASLGGDGEVFSGVFNGR